MNEDANRGTAVAVRWWTLVALAAILAAPSGVPAQAQPHRERTTALTLGVPAGFRDHYQGFVEAFEAANPGVTVAVSAHPPEGGDASVPGLDVILDFGGRLSTQRAHLRDLAPCLDGEPTLPRSDFYPPTLELLTLEGQLRILPAAIEPFAILYNKDLFDRYGVAYPEPDWDWAAFLSTAKAMTHPQEGVWGYGAPLNNGAETFYDSQQLVAQNGGRVFGDDAGAQPTFTEPATIEAVRWYVDLIDRHGVVPSTQDVPHNREGFFTGCVAMIVEGPLRTEVFPALKAMNLGIVSLPRGRASATGDSAILGFGIPAASSHPDEAWKLIAFLERRMPPRSQMPVRRSLAESDAYRETVGDVAAGVTRSAADQVPLFLFLREVTQPRRRRALGFFRQAIGKALAGQMTVPDALDWAQKQATTSEPGT